MDNATRISQSETIGIDQLLDEFLNLRVGEQISHLKIHRIRKITNPDKSDNLAGVDYKYLIESTDNKLLLVNTWSLWKKIAAALRQAGTIQAMLELKHLGIDDYQVRIL